MDKKRREREREDGEEKERDREDGEEKERDREDGEEKERDREDGEEKERDGEDGEEKERDREGVCGSVPVSVWERADTHHTPAPVRTLLRTSGLLSSGSHRGRASSIVVVRDACKSSKGFDNVCREVKQVGGEGGNEPHKHKQRRFVAVSFLSSVFAFAAMAAGLSPNHNE